MKLNTIMKEAVTVVSGNVLAQVIAFVAYFITTRLYTPEDLGLFNIFYSYIEVLIIISTCKYELAIVVADDNKEAVAVSRFALRLNTIVSIALLTIAATLCLTNMLPGKFAKLSYLTLLIPPMVFFCGTSRVYSFLYNRYHQYKQIALSETVNSGSGALLKILFGMLKVAPGGLPIGAVLGQAAANINYRIRLHSLVLPKTNLDEVRAAARKHNNFPRFVATKDFINTLSANLPFIFAANYFDEAAIGLFGLALTFTLQPINLISSAFERVLYAHTAENVRNGKNIGRLLCRFLLMLNAVAIPICVVAWFVAEPVFAFCFGSRWSGCTPYVQAILPWALVAINSMSLMYIPNVFSVQKIEFFFYIAMLVLRVGAIIIGVLSGSFLLTIRLFALVSALVHLALIIWYLSQVQRYELTSSRSDKQ